MTEKGLYGREDAVAPHFPYPNVQPTGRSAIVGGVKPTLTKRFDGDIAPKMPV
jgi:hypothetical protein